MSRAGLAALVDAIGACRLCAERPDGPPLPHEPRPVVRVSATAKLLIAGQAPGLRVHRSGLPFDDPSGDRLRAWMGVDRATFYDVARIGVAAMSFCFPGYDAQGSDLPPRRECARQWHDALFAALPQAETILAVGKYAQTYHLRRLGCAIPAGASVAATVGRWREFWDLEPRVIPLPHPSWRNSAWLKRNPWFEAEALPALRAEVARLVLT
ncbi:uracil-DNA glycosylase family protein [Methylosinus sp. Sm6]|uniref:uracil-DNA glycosylase family protein n=1 Tax=Methylosinus sp. Sm6 TaxID=2866948 RepID=UPI001C98F206|nr:uracil-DNA glycosylase family protein [Methylosinus sp. Sm6]